MRVLGFAVALLGEIACAPIEGEPLDSAGFPWVPPGDPSEPPPFTDARGTVRLVFASPDLGPSCAAGQACADLWVGQAPIPLASALPFGASTGPIAFPAASASVHLRVGANEVLGVPLSAIAPENPQTLLVYGLRSDNTLSAAALPDTIASPPAGKVRARVTHLLYGRADTVVELRSGANRVAPPLHFGETSELILLDRGAHTWTVDLDAPGLTQVPLRWNSADLGEAAPWLDLLIVPAPGTQALPLLLVHTPTSQAPVVFPPG